MPTSRIQQIHLKYLTWTKMFMNVKHNIELSQRINYSCKKFIMQNFMIRPIDLKYQTWTEMFMNGKHDIKLLQSINYRPKCL